MSSTRPLRPPPEAYVLSRGDRTLFVEYGRGGPPMACARTGRFENGNHGTITLALTTGGVESVWLDECRVATKKAATLTPPKRARLTRLIAAMGASEPPSAAPDEGHVAIHLTRADGRVVELSTRDNVAASGAVAEFLGAL